MRIAGFMIAAAASFALAAPAGAQSAAQLERKIDAGFKSYPNVLTWSSQKFAITKTVTAGCATTITGTDQAGKTETISVDWKRTPRLAGTTITFPAKIRTRERGGLLQPLFDAAKPVSYKDQATRLFADIEAYWKLCSA